MQAPGGLTALARARARCSVRWAPLIAAVERLTGRQVRTFMSGTDEGGGSAVEAFVLEPELAGEATSAAD